MPLFHLTSFRSPDTYRHILFFYLFFRRHPRTHTSLLSYPTSHFPANFRNPTSSFSTSPKFSPHIFSHFGTSPICKLSFSNLFSHTLSPHSLLHKMFTVHLFPPQLHPKLTFSHTLSLPTSNLTKCSPFSSFSLSSPLSNTPNLLPNFSYSSTLSKTFFAPTFLPQKNGLHKTDRFLYHFKSVN